MKLQLLRLLLQRLPGLLFALLCLALRRHSRPSRCLCLLPPSSAKDDPTFITKLP